VPGRFLFADMVAKTMATTSTEVGGPPDVVEMTVTGTSTTIDTDGML
jgi:hypothetical protein